MTNSLDCASSRYWNDLQPRICDHFHRYGGAQIATCNPFFLSRTGCSLLGGICGVKSFHQRCANDMTTSTNSHRSISFGLGFSRSLPRFHGGKGSIACAIVEHASRKKRGIPSNPQFPSPRPHLFFPAKALASGGAPGGREQP